MNASGLGCGWIRTCDACAAEFRAFSFKQNVCSVKCRFDFYRGAREAGACWEWTGPKLGGYGLLFLATNSEGRRKGVLAHRFAYELFKGPITDGLCVMHACDNRTCTNPDHLSLGTRGDNNRDRSAKGRSGSKKYSAEDRARYSEMFRGSANKLAKLTEESAAYIKYARDLPIKELAEKYGVSKTTIGHIRSGRVWRHV